MTVRIPPQQVNSLMAHHVWNSGLLLADRISSGELDVKGKVVLELGAGTGLPGLLCAREGAELVVLSDYDDPELVRNLEANIERALPDEALRKRVKATGHSWGEPVDNLISLSPISTFTLILLADCIWSSSSHTPLLTSLVALLSKTDPTASIALFAGFHSGRSTVRSFLRKALEVGLEPFGDWTEWGVKEEGEKRVWGWDLDEDGREPDDEKEDSGMRGRWTLEGQLRWKR